MFVYNPYLDEDKKIISEIYTSSEPLDNLKILCDIYGSRFPGTPGDLGSVKWMIEKLKSYGIENAYYETFKFPGWIRGPAKLELIHPIHKEFECISLPLSIEGEVESKLIFLGDGPIDIYEKQREKIEGNIVMVTSRNPLGVTRFLHRKEKYIRSILAGAKGWILMNQHPGCGPMTGSIIPIIPAVSVSYEDGCFLARLLEKEREIKIRITTTDKNKEITSYNVICDIPRISYDEEYVLSGCHYDGHDISQGAVDPASGTVTILEIARVLNIIKDKLKRRIRLVCFGAEELGMVGSYSYVIQHEEEMKNLRFMLNLDAAGGKRKKGIILHGHPELEGFIRQAASEMNAKLPYLQLTDPYSDHWPFFLKGVPSGFGRDPEFRASEATITRTARGYSHTRYDTVDKVELENLRIAASKYSRLLLRMANIDKWPVKRKTKEEINDFIRIQGWDQTLVLTENVEKYLKSWKAIHPDTIAWFESKLVRKHSRLKR